MELFQRSIAAGVLIACILILRGLAWKRLSKRVFTMLWKLAILRLLLPFSFQVENVWIESRKNYVMPWQDMLSKIMFLKNMEKEAAMETGSAGFPFLLFIWFLGMLFLALYFLLGYIRAYMLFREVIPVGNIDMDSIKTGGILTGRVGIAVTDRISTPIVYGIFRPKIILPRAMEHTMEKGADGKGREMLSFVLRHELTHIKYMDNLWKMLMIISLCLHWFNPLVYTMYYFLNKDMEIACDECVISAMNKKDRQRYAMTLVVLAETANISCLSGFGKSAVRERIREIMNYKKMTKMGMVLALVVLLGSTAVFVSAKEADAEAVPCASVVVKGESTGENGNKDGECASVFFEEGISEERIGEIGKELLAIDGVTNIGYTSADEAWEIFAREYLDEETVVSFRGENPLKDSSNYTVYLSDKNEGIIRAMEGISGVRRVTWR